MRGGKYSLKNEYIRKPKPWHEKNDSIGKVGSVITFLLFLSIFIIPAFN